MVIKRDSKLPKSSQKKQSAKFKVNNNHNQAADSDNYVRPKYLKDLVGREREKKIVGMLIASAQEEQKKSGKPRAIDHILFYGPPGLGKTTFAQVIGNEMGVEVRITSGPAVEKQGDLVALLTNIEPGGILFIDEIHRLRKNIEEILYSALEDFKVDIIIGQGPAAKSVRLNLPSFSLIGATTRLGAISAPLRDRFGLVQRLNFFDTDDLIVLLDKLAARQRVEITDEAKAEIAKRSRGTGRVAIRLFNRVKDYALLEKSDQKEIDKATVEEALDLLGVDQLGLDYLDREILKMIAIKFDGGPVGLNTLAASLSEEKETILDVYEPYLIKQGFIKRTSRGREVTDKVYEYLEMRNEK